jgi:hypothetical protein
VPDMTTVPLPDECHELPAVLTVATARVLAPISQVVPTALLEAAAAVLTHSAAAALEEVRANPRRRGNGPRRAGARADEELASLLVGELRRRQPNGSPTRPDIQMTVDLLPALGPSQWTFVARRLHGWAGTLNELWMVAQAIVPGEPPIDVDLGSRWSRRRRWAEEASRTSARARAQDWFAEAGDGEAAEWELRAAEARRNAESARAEAVRLCVLARIHEQAGSLGDAALERYENLVNAGTPPARAFQQARDNC